MISEFARVVLRSSWHKFNVNLRIWELVSAQMKSFLSLSNNIYQPSFPSGLSLKVLKRVY